MCLDEICPFTTLTVHFHVKQHFEKNLCVMSFVSRLCQYCDNRRCTSRGKTVVFWWKLMQMWRALPFIVIASHRLRETWDQCALTAAVKLVLKNNRALTSAHFSVFTLYYRHFYTSRYLCPAFKCARQSQSELHIVPSNWANHLTTEHALGGLTSKSWNHCV